MAGSPFLWTLIGCIAVVDVVGLFCLWRRRQGGGVDSSHQCNGAGVRLPFGDRRQADRRRSRQPELPQQTLAQRAGKRAII